MHSFLDFDCQIWSLDAYNVSGVDGIWCECYVFLAISSNKCTCKGKDDNFYSP